MGEGMTNKLKFIGVVAAAVLLAALSGLYVVNERQVAVVTQFARVVGTQEKAGLHGKLPFLHKVEYFDSRIQRLDVEPEMFLTNEKKYLIVDYFVEWRIGEVLNFYTSVQGNFQRASTLLDQLVKDALRAEFVQRSVKEVISEDRGLIMNAVTRRLQEDAGRYGVEIVGVRLKRVDFSDAIRDRVFDRMRAERERVSRSLRAQGLEKSQIIRADADREAAELMANANERAAVMRGEADAQAAKTYAKAYGKDLEFYQFWQSLQAYRASLANGNNTLIIEPNSQFFRYFDSSVYAPLELEGVFFPLDETNAPNQRNAPEAALSEQQTQENASRAATSAGND